MDSTILNIVIILLLIAINGLFAMSEIALVSSTKIKLQQMAKKGNKGAAISLKLMDEPEKFLSTVQVGITLIGIIAGAFGGITLAKDIEPFFAQFAILKKFADEISLILTITIITYLSLIIGELVPKAIAFNNPEKITSILAPFMNGLFRFALPVVTVLSGSTKLLLKLFRIKENSEPPVTEEELKLLIEQGTKYGTFEKEESDLLKNIFKFGDRKAYAIMTNRQDLVWIDINDKLETVKKIITNSSFSRFVVCEGSTDKVHGVVSVKDFVKLLLSGEEFDLRKILEEPLYIPDNLSTLRLLERFKQTKSHYAIVVDEYGTLQGMITLHDLIENIFGYLPDKSQFEEPEIISRDDGSLLIDGTIIIEELKEKLDLNSLPESDDYTTLGGMMMYYLKRIPKSGDKIELMNYDFEIMDMDGKRVDKVLVTKKTSKTNNEDGFLEK